jgi:hypothetical protein
MSYGTVQAEKMTTESGYSLGAGNASSFKNRIINGGMVIDQYNNGASINSTPNSGIRPIDRFVVDNFNSGTVACQRSTTAPAGFSNSLSLTVSSTDTPAAGDYLLLTQIIEGFNVADFGWGTADAKAITLSFWIRSSVAGTYGAGIRGGSPFQSYPFSYVINAANTWEFKTITIPGPTSGTFDRTNGTGFQVIFDLGSGSNFEGTANTWQSGSDWRVAGSLTWVSNAGATLFITGVQVEVGTVATSFDFRSIGTELALCQRYYFKQVLSSTQTWAYGHTQTTNIVRVTTQSPVPMRTTPSISTSASLVALYAGFNGSTVVAGGTAMSGLSVIDYTSTNITIEASATGVFGVITSYGFGGVNQFSAEL